LNPRRWLTGQGLAAGESNYAFGDGRSVLRGYKEPGGWARVRLSVGAFSARAASQRRRNAEKETRKAKNPPVAGLDGRTFLQNQAYTGLGWMSSTIFGFFLALGKPSGKAYVFSIEVEGHFVGGLKAERLVKGSAERAGGEMDRAEIVGAAPVEHNLH
jgi:hypothetical protein